MQKQDFQAMLKILHEDILNNAESNLQSGFRKCGIYPCDVSPLLERLPKCFRPLDVESSFMKFLEEKRMNITCSGSGGQKRGRKKIKIDAGKSIAHETENVITNSVSPITSIVPVCSAGIGNTANKSKREMSVNEKGECSNSIGKQRRLECNKRKKKTQAYNTSSSSECDDELVSYVETEESDWDEEEEGTGTAIHEGDKKWKEVKRVVGQFVVFHYEGELFPGVIEEVKTTGAKIKAMQRSLKSWKWPQHDDVMEYDWCDVIGGINLPIRISPRGLYRIPELDEVWQL